MTFCNSVNDLLLSARLHRALFRVPEIKLGCLVAPSARRTQSKGGTLELLLATYFCNSVDTEGMADPDAARRAERCDWRMAMEVVTCGKVEWAIISPI